MSILNDHRRCLELLDSGDADKQKLVRENLQSFKMTFGKHKGKSFRDIFFNDNKYVWWVCNKASQDSPTIKLFQRYCQANKPDKSFKSIMKVYTDRKYKIPEYSHMRVCEQRQAMCHHCDHYVDVKETLQGDECAVCGFSI